MRVHETLRGAMWKGIGSNAASRLTMAVASDRLVVVAYHGVPDQDRFIQHVDHYVRHFNVIGLQQLVEAVRGTTQLPGRSLLLTFDDGDRSVYENAFPVMAERALLGIIFVVTDLIDTDEPFWWSEAAELADAAGQDHVGLVRELKRVPDDARRNAISQLRTQVGRRGARHRQLRSGEILEMHRAGFSFGNHTASHPLLDRCDDAAVNREVVSAHERLTELLGPPPAAFAYPNGNEDLRVPPVLRSLGYSVAFTFDHHRASRHPADPFAISRLRVDAEAPLHEVRAITSGLHPLIHSVRQRLGRS